MNLKLPAISPLDVDNWKIIDTLQIFPTNILYAAESHSSHSLAKLNYLCFSSDWNLEMKAKIYKDI
jgi:hypothetical protein